MPCVPTKAAFFAWEAAWGKILTLDKLQRRGWRLPNRCYLCDHDEEFVHHILLHCLVVNFLWDVFFSLVGFSWVLSKTVKDAPTQLEGFFCWKNEKKDLEIYSPLHFLDNVEGA